MIFVDTGAWFAAFVPNDPHHDAARRWLDGNSEPLVTSDYVLDEVLTLLRVRGEQARAFILGEQILSESIVSLHLVTIREIQLAFDIFRTFDDK
jgi:predicted nucleic acid-binding protein